MHEAEVREEVYAWCDGLRRSLPPQAATRAMEDRIRSEPDETRRRFLKFVLARQYQALDDQSALDELRRQDPDIDVFVWYENLRRSLGNNDIVRAIAKRVADNPEAKNRRDLQSMLASHHALQGEYESAEIIYRRMFNEDRDDPLPLISLAEQKLYHEQQCEEAMRVIADAIEAAFRSGAFRRHALAVKARIALSQGDYRIVEDVLNNIVQLKIDRQSIDIGRERDVLDRLPPNSIDGEVARQYDQYCRAVSPTSS